MSLPYFTFQFDKHDKLTGFQNSTHEMFLKLSR